MRNEYEILYVGFILSVGGFVYGISEHVRYAFVSCCFWCGCYINVSYF